MTTATKRKLLGQEIFSVGEHTDSAGHTRTYTEADLDSMVRAFNAHVLDYVSCKLGHTSDAFREQVAQRLEVPALVLTGEAGDGQASLGEVVALRRDGGMLVADFELHPEIAKMCEEALFHDFSSEILIDYEGYPYVLSVVAFLGADRPAVSGMKPGVLLSQRAQKPPKAWWDDCVAKVSASSQEKLSLEELEEVTKAMDRVVQGKKSEGMLRQIWNQVKEQWTALIGAGVGTHPQEGEMKTSEIAKILKLQEGASEEDVTAQLAKMMKLLEAMAGAMGIIMPEEALPEEEVVEEKAKEWKDKIEAAEKAVKQSSFSSSEYAKQLQASDARIAVLERDKRVSVFRERVGTLTAVEGTPDQLASELVTIEDKMGKPAAEKTLAGWVTTQKFAAQAGVLERIGTARGGNDGLHPLEIEMETWAKENDKTMAEAMSHFRSTKANEWREYRQAARNGGE